MKFVLLKWFSIAFFSLCLSFTAQAARRKTHRRTVPSNEATLKQQDEAFKRSNESIKEVNSQHNYFRCSTPAQVGCVVLLASVAYWCCVPSTETKLPPSEGLKKEPLPYPWSVHDVPDVPCVVRPGLLPATQINKFVEGCVHPGIFSAQNGLWEKGEAALLKDCRKYNFFRFSKDGEYQCFPDQAYKRAYEFDGSHKESELFERTISGAAWNYIKEKFLLQNNPVKELFALPDNDFIAQIKLLNGLFNGYGQSQEFRNNDSVMIIRIDSNFPPLEDIQEWKEYIIQFRPYLMDSYQSLVKYADKLNYHLKKLMPDMQASKLNDIAQLPLNIRMGMAVEMIFRNNKFHEFLVLSENFATSPCYTPQEFFQHLSRLRKETLKLYKKDAITAAAYFHQHYIELHPHDDGNGRVARAIMNIILMSSGQEAVAFPSNEEYMAACKNADSFDAFLRKIIITQDKNTRIFNEVAEMVEGCETNCQGLLNEYLEHKKNERNL